MIGLEILRFLRSHSERRCRNDVGNRLAARVGETRLKIVGSRENFNRALKALRVFVRRETSNDQRLGESGAKPRVEMNGAFNSVKPNLYSPRCVAALRP